MHGSDPCIFFCGRKMALKPIRSTLVWQGSSWSFWEHELAAPNGRSLLKGSVHHPGAVVLIPLREQGGAPEVIMLRQYRLALGQTILELPAGTRGWDEDWLACAQRELREETGYRADSFTLLSEFWPTPGLSDEWMRLYLATGLTPDPLPGDLDEEITLHPIPLAEALAMAEDGRLQDAKSIIGVWQAWRLVTGGQ